MSDNKTSDTAGGTFVDDNNNINVMVPGKAGPDLAGVGENIANAGYQSAMKDASQEMAKTTSAERNKDVMQDPAVVEQTDPNPPPESGGGSGGSDDSGDAGGDD